MAASWTAAARGHVALPDECIYTARGWSMLRLKLPVVSRKGNQLVFRTTPREFAFQQCKARWVRPYVNEAEYPVLVDENATAMTVEGDICARQPRFIIYDASGGLRDILGMRGSPFKPMEVRVAAAIAVATKQCGTPPKALQFVGRKVTELNLDPAIRHQANTGKIRSVPPPRYQDFWSGTLHPERSALVEPDDPTLEAMYWEREDFRFDAQQRAEREHDERLSLGLAVGMLILGAAASDYCDLYPDATSCDK